MDGTNARAAYHQIAQWTPKVLATSQAVFVNEKHIMLETSVQMRLKTELNNDWIMMAVYVGIDTVEPFKQLTDQGRERLWEWYT